MHGRWDNEVDAVERRSGDSSSYKLKNKFLNFYFYLIQPPPPPKTLTKSGNTDHPITLSSSATALKNSFTSSSLNGVLSNVWDEWDRMWRIACRVCKVGVFWSRVYRLVRVSDGIFSR